jgi:hypothetical protein
VGATVVARHAAPLPAAERHGVQVEPAPRAAAPTSREGAPTALVPPPSKLPRPLDGIQAPEEAKRARPLGVPAASEGAQRSDAGEAARPAGTAPTAAGAQPAAQEAGDRDLRGAAPLAQRVNTDAALGADHALLRRTREERWEREAKQGLTRFAPPRKPPGGTLPSAAKAATMAATRTLFRVSVRTAACLLSATLNRDGLLQGEDFNRGADSGAVLVLHPGLHVVERLANPEAMAAGGVCARAAKAALKAGTYAMVAPLVFTSYRLATEVMSGDDLLARIQGAADPTVVVTASGHTAYPTTTALLGQWDGSMMPALAHAVDAEAARISEAAKLDGNVRTTYSLRLRARAALLSDALTRHLGLDSSGSVPEAAFVRALHVAQLEAAGARAEDTRPFAHDMAGITKATGVPRRTKEQTRYPWPRRELPPGHLQLLDVGAMAAEFFRLYGEPEPTSWIWEALQQCYEYQPAMEQGFLDTLAAAPAAVWAPGARETHVSTACTEAFEDVRLPELIANGCLRALTRDEATEKGRYIQMLRAVPKGKVTCPPRITELAGGNLNSPLPPHALAAVGEAANDTAIEMVAEVARLVAAGAHPPHAADVAVASQSGKLKTRAIVDGSSISEHMLGESFRFHYNDYMLARATERSVGFVHDLKDYFHSVGMAADQRKLWTLVYVDRRGVTHFYEMARMPMGSKTSASVAQTASALATAIMLGRRIPATISPYVDDFRVVCDQDDAAGVAQRVGEVLDLVYPGGEAMDKRTQPSRTPRFLGQVLDLAAGISTVPADTFYSYGVHLSFACAALTHADQRVRACVTTSSLEKLCGRLGWLSEAVPAGRAHLFGVYQRIHWRGPPTATVRRRLLVDLRWWHQGYLTGSLCPATIVTGGVAQLRTRGGGTDTAVQSSDAGEPGAAAISGGRVVHVTFNPDQRRWSSTRREMTAVYEGQKALDAGYVGKRVTILTDSMAAAGCINKGRSRDPHTHAIVQKVLERASGRYVMVAVFVPRERNVACDRMAGCATFEDAAAAASDLGLTLVSSSPAPKKG